MASRRLLRAAPGPYRAAVPPFVADLDVSLPSDLLAVSEDASRELTRFDAQVGTLTAPFASILLRTESASSSEVEQLTASAKQVALAELGDSSSTNAQLVVRNVAAMEAAIALSDELDTDAVLTMHRVLLESTAPDIAGHWRDQQVWIGGGGVSPHGAVFVPPHRERVPALMLDVMEFARRVDVPVLAQVAIAHAQFETVHPFPDGNGRTGRALVQGMLRAAGVTENVTVPVSAGLLGDMKRYFDALTAYRSGHVRPIIETLADAAFAAVQNGRRLAADIAAIGARWDAGIRARSDSSVHALRQLLLRQPVVTIALVTAELGVSFPTAEASVQKLVEAGVLTQSRAGRRNRSFEAVEVLAALDDFAARARRPRHGTHSG
ncbi:MULTISPECIES: Fic family protein [unclassified Rathayibacter]|uniref:Fic family protein n=1 Tax=unclassified Rathayibacter TaxID=2609250 RepID=UPI0010DD5FEC|nr:MULTISPECIES: Fic family protein [unclassified Rathayibacter]MCJ1705837.1 Fic family protein [Rathayibacter sp. VKM Ac-2926]TCL82084.1 Fic family protein [Rathayibacter sp. PhB192]TCM27300.1 Fic family protein [Rathayibacter sp. PhB179]